MISVPVAALPAAHAPWLRARIALASTAKRLVREAATERRQVNAARSDRAAFRDLYLGNVDGVYRYILRRTGEPALAEDLTADTFERALQAIERYQWRGVPIRYWLLRIADRVTTDWFRAKGRRPTTALPTDEQLPARASAEQEAMRRDELEAIRGAIDALPPAQRLVVVLRLGEGMSHRSIAKRLGRGEGAVRMLYQRGLQRVRDQLRATGA